MGINIQTINLLKIRAEELTLFKLINVMKVMKMEYFKMFDSSEELIPVAGFGFLPRGTIKEIEITSKVLDTP